MLQFNFLIISLFVFVISPVRSLLPEDDSSCYQRCFHQPPEVCPSPASSCRCIQLPNCKRAVLCCDVNKFDFDVLSCGNISFDSQIEALHIRNATIDKLNLSDPVWKRLKPTYMTITDGRIGSIEGEFSRQSGISCLNLSSNGIRKIEQRSLAHLFKLNFLDLSHNNLSEVPGFKKEGPVTVDISANHWLLCPNLLETLKRTETDFSNENLTLCLSSKKYDWFNSTEKLSFREVVRLLEIEKNCLENCVCMHTLIDIVVGKPAEVSASMNCSGIKLLSLPTPLPPRTIMLDVSNNNITSLKELSHPSYQDLRRLIADNNQISSIQALEGTKFMSNFLQLSLRNNKIKTIETYLLSNIKFDRTSGDRKMFLGLNKLRCDCKTAKEFKVWLGTKPDSIPDYKEILCEDMDVKVANLEQSKLCQSPQFWTDYIYYVITAEVLLLVGLIAKVSYDYWVLKTAGYLPWPANKMPKLPCDWLCE